METLFSVIREQLASLLEFRAITVVNEAVYAYYGDDMREDAVDIKIEGKPHPYGLLNYLASQSLEHSGVSVVVDFEPRLPSHKPTARNALISLAHRISRRTNGHVHFFCDSALAGIRFLRIFERMGAYLSVSLNTSATSGIQELYPVGISDLPIGCTRTLQKRQHIIQFTQRGDCPMVIASNAWDFEGDRRALRQPHLSYATAVSLLEHDEVDAIIEVFNLPENVDPGDIGEVILAASGQDITMPPPNAEGKVILDHTPLRSWR